MSYTFKLDIKICKTGGRNDKSESHDNLQLFLFDIIIKKGKKNMYKKSILRFNTDGLKDGLNDGLNDGLTDGQTALSRHTSHPNNG